jgi:hypothetical protein
MFAGLGVGHPQKLGEIQPFDSSPITKSNRRQNFG